MRKITNTPAVTFIGLVVAYATGMLVVGTILFINRADFKAPRPATSGASELTLDAKCSRNPQLPICKAFNGGGLSNGSLSSGLVLNGDFEWPKISGVLQRFPNGTQGMAWETKSSGLIEVLQEGSSFGQFVAIPQDGFIAQRVSTDLQKKYTLSFYAKAPNGEMGSCLSVVWDGKVLPKFTLDSANPGFVSYSVNLLGTGYATELKFASCEVTPLVFVDNVVLVEG